MPQKEPRIVVVDSQKLSSIQTCMKHYDLCHIQGYEPHVKPDFFERGSLTHDGLMLYYRLKKIRSKWQSDTTLSLLNEVSLDNDLLEMMKSSISLKDCCHSHQDIVDICAISMNCLGLKTALDFTDIENNIKTFHQYTEHYENDGWDNILAVEEVGSFVLWQNDDLIIVYEMKIDLIISLQNMPILPVDHKTGNRRVDPNEMSNQFRGYCVGLKVNNLFQNQIGFQKTLKPVEKFQRHLLSWNDDILNEWRDESAWWIRHGLDLIDRGIFPHNLTSCDKYSGCIYRPVCKKEPLIRQLTLNASFDHREEKWDVGKGL